VFESERLAGLAYDAAAREAWGDECYLNFPYEVAQERIGRNKVRPCSAASRLAQAADV